MVICYAGPATANETVDDISQTYTIYSTSIYPSGYTPDNIVTININVLLRESVPVVLKAMSRIGSGNGFKEVRNGGSVEYGDSSGHAREAMIVLFFNFNIHLARCPERDAAI